MKSEEDELNELQALFNDGNTRDSNLPVALYAKLEVFEENRRKAEKQRKEREKRALIIQENAERRYERSRQQREKMREKHGVAIEEHKARNLESGISTREQEALWQIEREEEKKQFIDKSRQIVIQNKHLLKQMAKNEEEDAARRLREGHEQRRVLDTMVKTAAEELTTKKTTVARQIKKEEQHAKVKAETTFTNLKQGKANNTKQAKGDWKEARKQLEEEYMAQAAEKRAKALAGREAARRVKSDLWDTKTSSAKLERENDTLVQEEKARILARNKVMRAERYRERFASSQEAEEFETSQLNHLYKFVK